MTVDLFIYCSVAYLISVFRANISIVVVSFCFVKSNALVRGEEVGI